MTEAAPSRVYDLSGAPPMSGSLSRKKGLSGRVLRDFDFDDTGDIGALLANLEGALSSLPPAGDVVLILPPRLVRARRLEFSIHLDRPLSHGDFNEVTEAVDDPSINEKGWVSLYRQPALYMIDHQTYGETPFGRTGKTFTAEFLDLSARVADLGRVEKLVTVLGHQLSDVLTPHEVLPGLSEDDRAGLLVHIGARDTVVGAVAHGQLTGAGALAAGRRHLGGDLELAGEAAKGEGDALAMATLGTPETASEERRAILEARLEELAAFARQISQAAKGMDGEQVTIAGLGPDKPEVERVFARYFPEKTIELVGPPDGRQDYMSGVPAALSVPRLIAMEGAQARGNPILRWLKRRF